MTACVYMHGLLCVLSMEFFIRGDIRAWGQKRRISTYRAQPDKERCARRDYLQCVHADIAMLHYKETLAHYDRERPANHPYRQIITQMLNLKDESESSGSHRRSAGRTSLIH